MQAILKFIVDTQERTGRTPSIREIMEEVGLGSPNTVAHHLNMLQKTGLITIVPNEDYGIRVANPERGIPVRGCMAAGQPSKYLLYQTKGLTWDLGSQGKISMR